jgi:hypothetical protein
MGVYQLQQQHWWLNRRLTNPNPADVPKRVHPIWLFGGSLAGHLGHFSGRATFRHEKYLMRGKYTSHDFDGGGPLQGL